MRRSTLWTLKRGFCGRRSILWTFKCHFLKRGRRAAHVPSFAKKACVRDAQSEIRPSVARQLGMLPDNISPKKPGFYHAWQHRSMLPMVVLTTSTLCKGMLVLGPRPDPAQWANHPQRQFHQIDLVDE